MHIFSMKKLREYFEIYHDTKSHLLGWHRFFDKNEIKNFDQIKAQFPTARIIHNSLVTFKILGNSYRLVASFDFIKQRVFIKFIGTHAQYDEECKGKGLKKWQ